MKSAQEKWFASEAQNPALKAMDVILTEMQNPTYRQVEEVLDCMRDYAKEFSAIRVQT